MTVIPPGYAEVTYKGLPAPGYREFMTSVGYVVASLSQADVDDMAEGWAALPAVMGAPTTASTTGITVKVGTSDPSAPITFESGETGVGGGSATMMPPNVSFLIGKTTNLGGRKGRGRNFLPWVREDKVDNVGTIDSTYRSDLQDAWVALIEGQEALIGGDAVLLHGDSTAPSPVVAWSVQSVVSTQRRRLVR